jgi:hypothetical protein
MEITKVDLKKQLKHLYNPSAKEVSVLEVPKMNYLMVDGTGDPNTVQIYKDAVEALYAVSYAIKFAVKKSQGIDYVVMPLEGLWWADSLDYDFSQPNRDAWRWTMMIMQPEFVSADLVQQMIADVKQKKNPAAISQMRFEAYDEGLAVQILYFGAYRDENPTIMRLHDTVHAKGYELRGKHHEIYIGDPRKTAPERLKTVIRQPMRAK